MIKEKKPNYTSFSISIMDNNTGKLYDHLPIYLENHPCEYAREIYKLGFKFCKWMNKDKQKSRLVSIKRQNAMV